MQQVKAWALTGDPCHAKELSGMDGNGSSKSLESLKSLKSGIQGLQPIVRILLFHTRMIKDGC